VGYSDPKTISSKGAVRKMPDGTLNAEPTGYGKYPPGGIQEFAPTVMAAVPKIWDILKKGVESVVGKGSPVVQSLFLAAFAARSIALKQGRTSPLCSKIFKKMHDMMGGRLKLCVSGGGPISADIQNFIRVGFNVNLIQGYGLTETCAAGTVQPPFNAEDGVAGAPISAVGICIFYVVCKQAGRQAGWLAGYHACPHTLLLFSFLVHSLLLPVGRPQNSAAISFWP